MPKGVKTGGRVKGTPNKKNSELVIEAKAAGLLPLDYMLSVLRDETLASPRRDWAAEKAAPYLHAKLTSNEHSGADGGPLTLIYEWRKPSESTAATSPGESSKPTTNGHNGSALGLRTEGLAKPSPTSRN
jgi:hypothetical protein